MSPAMRAFDTPLPIDEALPDLTGALATRPNAVLVAPRGAGKTTRVPLALLDEPWVEGRKLILLEPRRLAARAAADRMARSLGEEVGGTIGLRVRLGSKVSRGTRLEVVTEGVFARMILDDPSLDGVAAVLFDEFHERSLDADLGLAFALDAQAGLREDLRLLVMSATLDGALERGEQDRAVAPAPAGRRKIVLATSIAETSLTIEGVRVVVDSGLSRVPVYEPDIGLTRLETVRVSRAAADQRRGRAGRTEPGICYRLWDEPQTASLAAYTPPEILSADLSSFLLDLAQWGVRDPATLAFLDPPPAPALKEANILLLELGALDSDGRITAQGRSLLAAPIAQGDIETRFADQIEDAEEISFDRGAMALRGRRRRTLHAITLSEAPVALSPSAETARIFAAGLAAVGLDKLPWSKSLKQWRDRVMFLRKAEGDSWPDLSDAALAAEAENWLVPALYGKTSLKDFSPG